MKGNGNEHPYLSAYIFYHTMGLLDHYESQWSIRIKYLYDYLCSADVDSRSICCICAFNQERTDDKVFMEAIDTEESQAVSECLVHACHSHILKLRCLFSGFQE